MVCFCISSWVQRAVTLWPHTDGPASSWGCMIHQRRSPAPPWQRIWTPASRAELPRLRWGPWEACHSGWARYLPRQWAAFLEVTAALWPVLRSELWVTVETTGWPHFPLKCVVFQNSFKMLPFLPSFSTSVKKKRPYTKINISWVICMPCNLNEFMFRSWITISKWIFLLAQPCGTMHSVKPWGWNITEPYCCVWI